MYRAERPRDGRRRGCCGRGGESAEAASKRAEAAEAEAEAARAEAQRLSAENARLLETLARASSDDGGGASDGGPTLDTTGSGKGGAFRPAFERMSTRLPDPLRERALFAAVGFDVMTKGYSQPDMVKLRELLAEGIVNLNCRDGKGSPHSRMPRGMATRRLCFCYSRTALTLTLPTSTTRHPSTFVCSIGRAALQRYCAAGADASVATDDAAAVGSREIKAIFQAAATGGRQHPMLQAAAAKVDAAQAGG